jgi:predicted GNAT superfamily acetyltransferase
LYTVLCARNAGLHRTAPQEDHLSTPTPPRADAITIRHLASQADYDACVALQDDTWGHGFTERVPGAILRVGQKMGGVTAGAFDADGRMLGFVFGLSGLRHGLLAHWSDMLAVHSNARGLGLGARLKQFQREAVQALGIDIMLWTADPLVARNAHFNINHLGAYPVEYVENMYGNNTGSVLHGAMPTDRCVYHWALSATGDNTRHRSAPAPAANALAHAISVSSDGVPANAAVTNAAVIAIAVPGDLEQLTAAHPTLALTWRHAVRTAFAGRLGHGYSVTHFVRGHNGALPFYVLTATR